MGHAFDCLAGRAEPLPDTLSGGKGLDKYRRV